MERIEERNKKSLSFIFFGIGLNLLIIYAIFELEPLLIASIIFFSISILIRILFQYIFISNSIKSVKHSPSPYNDGLRDDLALAKKFVWNNRRHIFVTSIGLFLSLLIISQSILISSTYQQNAFDEYVSNDDKTGFSIIFENVDTTSFMEWDSYFQSYIDDWFSSTEIKLTSNITEINLKTKLLLGRSFSEGSSYAHFSDSNTHLWNYELQELYRKLPSFPGNHIFNKSILILPPLLSFTYETPLGTSPTYFHYPPDFTISNSSGVFAQFLMENVVKPNFGDLSTDFYNITLQFDDVWQFTYEDIGFIESNDMHTSKDFTFTGIISPNNSILLDYYNVILKSDASLYEPYIWGNVGYSTKLFISLPLFKNYPLEQIQLDYEFIASLIAFDSIVYHETLRPLIEEDPVILNIQTPYLILIKDFANGYKNIQVLLLIFSIPLILISLFLLYFSLNVLEKRKERVFSQLVTRGASIKQLRIILLLEVISLALFCSIIAISSAIPLSRLFLRSTGIFQFSNKPVILSIPNTLFWKIPIVGFLLAVDFNLGHFNKLSTVQVEEDLEKSIESKPSWVKYNVDLILFSLILLFWGILLLIPISNQIKNKMFSTIGPIILIITIIAVPLVIGRYFLDLIAKMISVVKSHFDLIGVAFNNLSSNKNFTGKLLALLSITVMINFTGLIMIDTMNVGSTNASLYDLGAEVVLEYADYYHFPLVKNNIDLLKTISINGIESKSFARYIEYNLGIYDVPPNTKPSDFPNKLLYGIQPDNFSDAGYWNDKYSNFSLSYLMDQFKLKPNALILPTAHAEYLHLQIGDTFNFMYGRGGAKFYEFELIGTVDYFPRIINEPDEGINGEITSIYLILNFNTLNELWMSRLAGSNDLEKFITLIKSKGDPRQVFDEINLELIPYLEQSTSLGTVSVREYNSNSKPFFDFINNDPGLARLESDISFITLHSIFLFTIIIGITGTTFYSTIFLNKRKKEFGIYRALGMKHSQTSRIIYYELVFLILISLLLGLISSIVISYLSFKVILAQKGEVFPPFVLQIPYQFIGYMTGLFVFISAIIAYIPARSFSRSQTGNILRVI